MPVKNAQTTIIDLTDIIESSSPAASHRKEEEELSGHVSDLMKSGGAGDDIELDDLLAQLNDGDDDAAAPSERVVNPNESLNMPGMDDMDAMLGGFGSPSSGDAGASQDASLDDLLAELDGPKPAAAREAKAVEEADATLDDLLAELDAPKAPAGRAAPPAEDAELDDLLAGLDDTEPAKPVQPSVQTTGPASGADDLDALFDELDSKPSPGRAAQPAPATDTDVDLDALLADLDSAPVPSPAPVPEHVLPSAGIEDAPAPAVEDRMAGSKADEMLNNLLEGLDVPPSGPMERSGSVPEIDTAHIDALLDGEAVSASPSPLQPPAAASDAALAETVRQDMKQELEQELRQELEQGLDRELEPLRTRLEQAVEEAGAARVELELLRQSLGELRERADAPAPEAEESDTSGRLDAVEERCASLAGELAGIRELMADLDARLEAVGERPASVSAEQLDGVVAHVMIAMRAEIEKAAAASAAKVIREEISALFTASGGV